MRPIDLVGLGPSPEGLPPSSAGVVARAQVLVGGRKLLDLFPDHPARRIVIASPLELVLAETARAAAEDLRVVVLASGDPLFYGIGPRLVAALGRDSVNVHPNLTWVQVLAARLKESWAEAMVISLHGRGEEPLALAAGSREPVYVYTDPERSPAFVGAWLESLGQPHRPLVVAEALGREEERISSLSAREAAEMEFAEPNLVLIRPLPDGAQDPRPWLGNPEESFSHQAGLITKAEIRAVALAYLGLIPGLTMWDLGAGSGAVAIEAAGLVAPGRVFAVERRPARLAQIRENVRSFQRANVEPRELDLPRGLDRLPDPDRIFIGGGGSRLGAILEEAMPRLKPGGIVVLGLATWESLAQAMETLDKHGFKPIFSQVQVNRLQAIPGRGQGRGRLAPLNPVFLVRGSR